MSRPETSLGDRLLGSPTVQTLSAFVVVFVAMQVLWFVSPRIVDLVFLLSAPVTLRPWTLVTSVYSHASVGHLLSNAILLALVGIPLERATKGWAYHAFFVLTGAIAGLSQVWAVELLDFLLGILNFLVGWLVAVPAAEGGVRVLGASGAVFAMFGYVLAGNRLASGLFRKFDVPSWVQIAAFVAVAALATWMTAAPGVALVAHFTGGLVGLVAGRIGILPSATPDSGTERRSESI